MDKHLQQVLSDIFEAALDPDFGITQSELAEEAGLCRSTISKLVRGLTKEPRFTTVRRLAVAAGMDLELAGLVKPKRKRVA